MTVSQQIVDAVKRIPPLSDSAVKLLALVGKGEQTAMDVARIVEVDPVLTARVLRIVNSPAYGLRVAVESVTRAVAYLGDKTVLGVALESCTGDLYRAPLAGYEAERDSLWAHSLYTAIGAREMAKHSISQVSPDVAYTAGLLHDIGKAVIDEWLAEYASEIIQQADVHNENFDDKERERLQTDHAEVGGLILSRWGLPETLCQAVAFHHTPSKASEPTQSLAFAVHLGDFLAMMDGVGTGADTLLYALEPDYASWISIQPKELERVSLAVGEEYRKIMEAMKT